MRLRLTLALLGSLFASVSAQNAYSGAMSLLNVAPSPRIGAMGAHFAILSDHDIQLAWNNPMLVTDAIHQQAAVNVTTYLKGNVLSAAAYSHSFDRLGSWMGSLQFMSYGKVPAIGENGEDLGTVSAASYLLSLSWSKELIEGLRVGASLRGLTQTLDVYTSGGFSTDVGVSYEIPEQQFASMIMLRNMGAMFRVGSPTERLPFEIVAGASVGLKHAPFRFHLFLQHLQRWNLSNFDKHAVDIDPFTGDPVKVNQMGVFMDNLMRHIVPSIEIQPHKIISLQVGFNYHRRKELALQGQEVKKGLVGFSYGVTLNFRRIHLSYGRSTYHLAGSPNYIGLAVNF